MMSMIPPICTTGNTTFKQMGIRQQVPVAGTLGDLGIFPLPAIGMRTDNRRKN